jgi:hypothetical protein
MGISEKSRRIGEETGRSTGKPIRDLAKRYARFGAVVDLSLGACLPPPAEKVVNSAHSTINRAPPFLRRALVA